MAESSEGSFPYGNTWKILEASTPFPFTHHSALGGHSYGLLTLCKANRPAAPTAEAGSAGLTGGAGVGRHHRDAAAGGHGARGNLAARGGAIGEASTADSAAGAADANVHGAHAFAQPMEREALLRLGPELGSLRQMVAWAQGGPPVHRSNL